MGLTSALYSTLTGLNANQQRLDVIGNNISNVNTVGFKSSDLNFETLFSQTISNGSKPSTETGGTNPFQIGLGVKDGAATRDFSDGSQQTTGINTDLALQGDGFFIVQGQDSQNFTRDGTFKLNSSNQLVTADGGLVQGYAVDGKYNVIQGPLSNISVPLGSLTIAQATSSVSFAGEFNGAGTVASTITNVTQAQPLYLANPVIPSVTPSATAPAGTDLLTNIVSDTNVPYFQVGDVVTVTAIKGSSTKPPLIPKTLTVTATTTLQQYTDFMSGVLGLDTAVGANGALPDAGVTLQADPTFTNAVDLNINGNRGTVNGFTMDRTSIGILRAGSPVSGEFSFNSTPATDGESVSTTAKTYDSLGNEVNLAISATLVSQGSTGSTWQFLVTSPDSTTGAATGGVGTQEFVADGTLQFDNNGKLFSSTTPTIAIDRSGTGATPSLQMQLSFGKISALAGQNSSLNLDTSDGAPEGVLNTFSIDADGTVVGGFSNGQSRSLGQVAIATFRNNQGLIDIGNNSFAPGANSGLPVIGAPGTGSAGTIVAGALELSNVDLSKEFVNLISASTGFSASSRIITTSNQLLQDLLQSTR